MDIKKSLILLLVVISLVGCINNTTVVKENEAVKKIDSKSINYEEVSKILENDINYLFYHEPLQQFTIYFPFEIEKVGIQQAFLYLNEKLVTKNIEILSFHNNKLTFQIGEFVPEFNIMQVILDSGEILRLYTGTHHLEEWKMPLNKPDMESHVANAHSFINQMLEYTSDITLDSNDLEIKVLLPTLFVEKLKIKQPEIDRSGNTFKYMVKIPKEYLQVNKITTITFEAIWFQEKTNQEKYILIKESVPVTFKDGTKT